MQSEFIFKIDNICINGLQVNTTNDIVERFKEHFINKFVNNKEIEQEFRRIQSCIDFYKKYNIEHQISYKVPTVGCEEAITKRYNPATKNFGIELSQEQKSVIFKKGKDVYCYITTADYEALPPKKSSQLEISKYGVISYTVNPATIFLLVDQLKQDKLTPHIVINPSIAQNDLMFNNYGSRILSVSFNGQDVYNAIIQEAKEKEINVEISSEKFCIPEKNVSLTSLNSSNSLNSTHSHNNPVFEHSINSISINTFGNESINESFSLLHLLEDKQEQDPIDKINNTQLMQGDYFKYGR